VLFAVLPFGVLPDAVGGTLFVVASIAGLVWALRLLGVNDWRCYAVAVLSWPAVFGFWLGSLSPLLLLGFATVWRLRAKVLMPAMALAAIVVAKIFPWPLGLWMVMTRRWRALGVAGAVAAAVLMGCWAAIGFAGMTAYPHMLTELSSLEDRFGSSLVAQLLVLGVPLRLATVGGMAVGAALLIAAWRLARRDGDEARAFGLAVMAALVASPLAWPHYFVLLFVPVALMAPRLTPLWFVPTLCGLSPEPGNLHPWDLCPYLAAVLIVTCHLLAPSTARTGSALARALRRRSRGGVREGGVLAARR
jgi:hypothetical protein